MSCSHFLSRMRVLGTLQAEYYLATILTPSRYSHWESSGVLDQLRGTKLWVGGPLRCGQKLVQFQRDT